MSKFQAGQRVRLAKPVHAENVGLTGRISHLGHWLVGDELPCGNQFAGYAGVTSADCCVLWDAAAVTGEGQFRHTPSETWRLEPLTPLGAAPSELTFTELMDRCRAGEGVPA